MKKDISLLHIVGYTFTVALGTVLHFLYQWTDKSIYVSPFSAINESTWEHMKILFIPLLIFSIIEYFTNNKGNTEYVCSRAKSILLAIWSIPLMFYTYNGIIGKSSALINIAIFFISAVIPFVNNKDKNKHCGIYILLLIINAIAFVVFTYYQPMLELFRNPLA